ncbi:MAG: outer membrane protein assembly factor BamC, partial [Gammaproteobacteria bacterium]|nr:outer membrane protein assembly factor BamC [Gammaproteobacteria bacterium]
KTEEEKQREAFTDKKINYYSDKTVSSLDIPPDLTTPSSQKAFKLSQYVSNAPEKIIDFSVEAKEKQKETPSILKNPSNIEVKKSGNRRWLVVGKKPDTIWGLSKSFLKSNGFSIKKVNKKIGLIETDFLENRAEIPTENLGMIRGFLGSKFSAYVLPTVDKYRIRLEPINSGNKTAVYLSLNSMAEVATNSGSKDESTIWQSRPKDQELETAMLYKLMVYLGGNHAQAREKIITVKEQEKIAVNLTKGVGGYAKLVFPMNRYDAWDNVGWALDQLDVNVEDKDVKEGSFYIYVARTQDKGWFSRIFGESAIKKSFQILVRQTSSNATEVYFNDISEENEQETIDFSHEFLGNIAKQF